jgi:hypothetical protein
VSLQTTRHEIHGAQTPNAASDSFFSKKTLTGLDRSFLSRKSDDGKAVGPCKRHVLKYSKMHIAMSILLAEGGRLEDTDIDLKIAKAAIDLIITNAIASKKRPALG